MRTEKLKEAIKQRIYELRQEANTTSSHLSWEQRGMLTEADMWANMINKYLVNDVLVNKNKEEV